MDIGLVFLGILGVILGAFGVYFYLNGKLQKLTVENIELKTQLTEKEKTYEFIKSSKTQMQDDFKKISDAILKQDKLDLTAKNTELLSPLEKELKQFKQRIETITKEQSDDRSALKQQIQSLSQKNEDTLKSAEKLTNALTYDNKQQGDWGEMVLESILADSGLKKDQQYHIQKSLKDDDGNILRPDIIVNLPDKKDIIIDSKVSLKHYQNYTSGDSEALVEHIKSVSNHIKNISLKAYENLVGVNTLDYIFVFFPIEASLLVALEKKPDLFNDALKKNVALVSPSTLMMSLKTINHIWNTERQNQNTEEIVRQAEKMYGKLVGFLESMNDIEKHLDKAQNSYKSARSKLSEGNGNLIGRAQKLQELGVQSKKQISEA
ncbi:MAG: DNA recombination protein RmuC [Candidatus Thioglobus sp.]|nr:DNA recombination protein RmuC [Candidatus Thioglobus sp.]